MIKNFYKIYIGNIASKISLSFIYNLFKLGVMFVISMMFNYAVNGEIEKIFPLAVKCILVVIVVCTLKYLLQIKLSIRSKKNREKFKFSIYESVLKSSFESIESRSFGEVSSRISKDVDKIIEILEEKTILLIVAILSGGSYLAYSLNISLTFSAVVVLMGICTLIIPFLLRKAYDKSYRDYGVAWETYESHLNETLKGFSSIKLNNLYSLFEANNKKELLSMQKVSNSLDRTNVAEKSLKDGVKNIGEIVMYVIIGFLTYKNEISTGQIVICLFLGREIFNTFPTIFNEYHSYQNLSISIERLSEIISEEVSLGQDISGFDSLKVNNLNFAYKDNESVLNNIQMEIEKGDKVLIRGANGAGKSTLVKLLLNLYGGYEGEITLNNGNLKDYKRESIKEVIGYVPQEQFFISDSIMENLRLFSEDEERLENHLKEFYLSFEDLKGKNISELSGGQKQKVALTRLLASDFKVIILDEPTNYLDFKSIESLKSIIKSSDKTLIVISHHKSIEEVFNKGYLLKDGNMNVGELCYE